jgi:hypothetical protein
VIELKRAILRVLDAEGGKPLDAPQVAERAGAAAEVETVHLLLQRLAADPTQRVQHVSVDSESRGALWAGHPDAKFRITR